MNHLLDTLYCLLKYGPKILSSAVPVPWQTVLNKDTVEQVLVGQSQWEDSVVGRVCVSRCMDRRRQRQQTQSLIRGIVKARSRRARGSLDIQ